jgi:RHS repeat-associated protein
MLPASIHGDPQLGIDVHLCTVPPSPSPVPMPVLHVSIVFDPFDYIPFIGATVTVCGMKRATAGTGGIVIHIPICFPPVPAPKPPEKDDELFMGSKTVVADGDPFSFLALPVLGCQVAGIVSPPRLKKKKINIGTLPTTFNIAIPTSVFVGGPPTISMMGMLFKGAFAALGKFAKSGVFQKFMAKFKAFRQKLFKNMDSGFLKCKILRAEPVNILTGEVSVEHEDFTLPGRIPVVWSRSYQSGSDYEGLSGRGWETPADARLEIDAASGIVSMQHAGMAPLLFAHLPAATGDEAGELELMDGSLLTDHGDEFRVRTKADLIYHFPKALAQASHDGGQIYPIGRIADLCGNWLDFERRAGVLTAINESAGRRINLDIADGRIREVSLTMPGSDLHHIFVRYEYDRAGDLVAAVDELGHPRRFGYAQRRLVRHTDRNGLSFYYEYDKQGDDWRVIHAWGDGGLYDYKFEYLDALGERRITDSLGHVSIVTLDDRGLPICEIDPLDGKTTFEYDEAGRTTAVVNPGGLRTEYVYDAAGNLLKTVLPDGSAVSAAFDENHKPVSLTDPEGGQWRQEWDARGNLTRQSTPSGAATRYDYNEQGDLLCVTHPAQQRTTLHYDPLGFVAGLTDASGQRTQFKHDALGNLFTQQLANGDATHYRYDAKNRLVESMRPDSKRIQCRYDPEDSLTRYRDEAGRETLFTYYGMGSLQSRTDPDGSKVEYHYDTEEQLISVSNQPGKRWQLKRDAAGRLIEEVDYWNQSRQYAYDAAGHLTCSTNPLGQILAITCDKLGRIVKKQASEETETFHYNKRGQLTAAQNPFSKIERQYNQDGQLTKEKQRQAHADAEIGYAYNPAGQLIEQQVQHQAQAKFQQTQRYAYNALGQPESVQIDEHEPIRFTFDEIGRLTHQQQNQHLALHYRYNQAGQLISQGSALKGQLQTQIDYDYDDAGNLIRRHDSRIGTDQYRYDLLGQVISHADPTGHIRQFVYSKTGDRFKTVREDSKGRNLQHPDGSTWQLDKAGQLVQKWDAKGQSTLLEWDAFGRLRGLTRTPPASESSGAGGARAERYEYHYDPLGRRVCKVKVANPLRYTPAETTRFVWNGDAMVGEVKERAETSTDVVNVGWVEPQAKPNNAPLPTYHAQFYSYHLGSFAPLAMQVQTLEGKDGIKKSLYYYQNDLNGMPLRLQDGNGVMVWEGHYSAFGLVDWLIVEKIEPSLRLHGQYYDVESGLHYNRHRYFDPGAGCFISKDPIGLEGGLNPYEFALNVLRWSDPLGLSSNPVDDGIVQYGDTILSRLVQGARHMSAQTGTVNFAAFMYIGEDGRINILIDHSRKGRHAERWVDELVDSLRIDPGRIIEIYSELEPCDYQNCKNFLKNKYKNAHFSWSFPYHDKTERKSGMSQFRTAIRVFFYGCEDF